VPGPNPIVRFRVDPTLRARLASAAQSNGMTESELMRRALLREIEGAGKGTDPIDPHPDHAHLHKLTVRLPAYVWDAARTRAAAVGMAPSRWMANLVQSHVSNTPVLTDAELLTLEAALRELTAVGRNVNQIARALNQAHFETERVRLDYLSLLNDSITATRDEVRGLVRASRNAWGAA
jgi:hypothetical protein